MVQQKKTGNRIIKINNSKYTAIINEKEYPIFFSYGLKKMLFELISNAYLNSLKTLGAQEVATEKKLTQLQNILSKTSNASEVDADAIKKYAESLTKEVTQTNLTAGVEHHFNVIREFDDLSYQIVSMVLTQRDNKGDVVKEIDMQTLLYSSDFVDADDVIQEIYELVSEKYLETAKKNTNLMENIIKPITGM